jgi:hypothetical protein
MRVEQPKFYYYDRHKADCRRAYCEGGCKADKKGSTYKVRMKGVPREDSEGNPLQTRAVFDHLRARGGEDEGWATNEKGEEVATAATTVKDGVHEIHFERLEQVRGMVRHNLTSPVMEPVRRAMVSTYDKRKLYPDGTTMPLLVDDPRDLESARKLHRARELG